MTTIELMSPVGSYEALMAAIQAGAGSVYFGVGKLNMRSRSSQNFTIDDLVKIVELCKENNVRSYLTLNAVIFDNEIEEMKSVVDKALESGVTAVIASDISVMDYCKMKGVNVHISTQCNITNLQAVKFYAQYADVMVMARELTLQQVSEIVAGIERENIKGPSGELVKIEIFVHGALCMAVSGKCYLSLDNMNYSANRGACLQLCRRSYLVTDKEEGFELEVDHEYIMSPKDLCTIGFLDKIIDAGVKVLKIEGRGRGPEYVKTVTQCYKEAIEAVLQKTYSQEKITDWEKRLSGVFNRGFWDGYYLGRKMGEWSKRYGSQATRKKLYIGKITNFFSNLNVAEIKMETNDLSAGEEILITGPTTGVIEQTADEIRVNLQITAKTVKGEMCSIKTVDVVRRGDKVYKMIAVEEKY
jgi:U32 family peptidase